ncbi:hypothetical protein [Acetobacter oeni]|uniref:Uncharacterized protein n=1 Tax=Acetobacter oeni TaxID=304077 RepID=A0A511XM03_9PROT|nr:hypothetical protein [Acetobacter oeni]MBB3882920.1 hypothetical protein [Acetobacter oeni]NHO19003.1 hypothetical protein [Acetobacter oeni]GBR04846.1 hypothetical protein AA21952_1548 [Acetobacter oeni LMG 21952]GEN63958.1 hypothetical protein AOE01nite_21820 [Acetobacter oeni]
MAEDPEIMREVETVIIGSALCSPDDSPETTAAMMVLAVCRHLGIDGADAPQVLLAAVKGVGPGDGESG